MDICIDFTWLKYTENIPNHEFKTPNVYQTGNFCVPLHLHNLINPIFWIPLDNLSTLFHVWMHINENGAQFLKQVI